MLIVSSHYNIFLAGKKEQTVNFFDFSAGLNKLMDVLDVKIKKEKDKVQEK